jgi:hypothetical protein
MSGGAAIDTHTHETLLGGSAAKDTPGPLDVEPHTYIHTHTQTHYSVAAAAV